MNKVILRENVILGELIDVKPKDSTIILPNEKQKDKYFFDEHPIQVKVKYVGINKETYSFFDGKTGTPYKIKPGDILYLDRFPSENEYVLLNKNIYVKVLVGNILCVISEKE